MNKKSSPVLLFTLLCFGFLFSLFLISLQPSSSSNYANAEYIPGSGDQGGPGCTVGFCYGGCTMYVCGTCPAGYACGPYGYACMPCSDDMNWCNGSTCDYSGCSDCEMSTGYGGCVADPTKNGSACSIDDEAGVCNNGFCEPEKCGGVVIPEGSDCCGDEIYNVNNDEDCCINVSRTVFVKYNTTEENQCCPNGMPFNDDEAICCGDGDDANVYDKHGISPMDKCCGTDGYDSATEGCCERAASDRYGALKMVYSTVPSATVVCCEGTVVSKNPAAGKKGCCGGKLYDPEYGDTCCGGKVIKGGSGDACCGSTTANPIKYNAATEICCGNTTNPAKYDKTKYDKCCADFTNNPVPYNTRKGEKCCLDPENNINICDGCQICVTSDGANDADGNKTVEEKNYTRLFAPTKIPGGGSTGWRCSDTPYSVSEGQCVPNCQGCTQCKDNAATGGKSCKDTSQILLDEHMAAHPGDATPLPSYYPCICGSENPNAPLDGGSPQSYRHRCINWPTDLYSTSVENCPTGSNTNSIQMIGSCMCSGPTNCETQKNAKGISPYKCSPVPCPEAGLVWGAGDHAPNFYYDCGDDMYCCQKPSPPTTSRCGGPFNMFCVPWGTGAGCSTILDCNKTNGGGGGPILPGQIGCLTDKGGIALIGDTQVCGCGGNQTCQIGGWSACTVPVGKTQNCPNCGNKTCQNDGTWTQCPSCACTTAGKCGVSATGVDDGSGCAVSGNTATNNPKCTHCDWDTQQCAYGYYSSAPSCTFGTNTPCLVTPTQTSCNINGKCIPSTTSDGSDCTVSQNDANGHNPKCIQCEIDSENDNTGKCVYGMFDNSDCTFGTDRTNCPLPPKDCTNGSDCYADQYCCDGQCSDVDCVPPPDCATGADCSENQYCCDGFCSETECSSDCNNGSDCSWGQYCCDGICSDTECINYCIDGSECSRGQYCCDGICSDEECVPPPTCTYSSDCSENQYCCYNYNTGSYCSDTECVPPPTCTDGSDCSASQYCCDGICSDTECVPPPTCTDGSDCSNGQYCCDGICSEIECNTTCTDGSDCSAGQYCCDGKCSETDCNPSCANGSDCSAGQYCCDGKCSETECVPPPTCTDGSDCALGQYCCDGVCSETKCSSTCTDGSNCSKSQYCCDGKCSDTECVPPPTCTNVSQCSDGQSCCSGICSNDKCDGNEPPSAINLSASPETAEPASYCSYHWTGIPGSGLATFSWEYNDAENNTQTGYQIQISVLSGNDFADGIVYSTKMISGTGNKAQVPVYIASTNPPSDCANALTTCGSYINYGVPYYWRVRVQESGRTSAWAYYSKPVVNNTYTYPYGHPPPFISYTPPLAIPPGQSSVFQDNSTCYDADGLPHLCKDYLTSTICTAAPNYDGNSTKDCYGWWFDNITKSVPDNCVGGSCAQGNGTYTFVQPITYSVNLRICDDIGCCEIPSTVTAGSSIPSKVPQWWEVSPY